MAYIEAYSCAHAARTRALPRALLKEEIISALIIFSARRAARASSFAFKRAFTTARTALAHLLKKKSFRRASAHLSARKQGIARRAPFLSLKKIREKWCESRREISSSRAPSATCARAHVSSFCTWHQASFIFCIFFKRTSYILYIALYRTSLNIF